MKTLCAIFCLSAATAFGQGFTLRNAPFVGNAAPVVAAGNVFANVTHVWHLGEAIGNTRVDSVGSLNLAETGGTVASSVGINGNCAEIGTWGLSTSAWTESSTFSIVLWFKMLSMSGVDPLLIAQKGTPEILIDLEDNGDTTSSSGVLWDTTSYPFTVVGGPFNFGGWHMVAAVLDGSTVKVSLDGATFNSQSGSCTPASTTLSFKDTYNELVFDLDEVMFWDGITLTQGNVTTLWNGGTGTFHTP